MTRLTTPWRTCGGNRWRATESDDGSMLPLVIGVVVIVLTLVTVVTDTGALWLQRRALQSTVDAAALAGAQAVDLPALYLTGTHGDLRLSPTESRQAVRSYVAALPSGSRLQGLRVTVITVSRAEVTVRGTAVARLPFLALISGRGVPLVAQASAQLSVSP